MLACRGLSRLPHSRSIATRAVSCASPNRAESPAPQSAATPTTAAAPSSIAECRAAAPPRPARCNRERPAVVGSRRCLSLVDAICHVAAGAGMGDLTRIRLRPPVTAVVPLAVCLCMSSVEFSDHAAKVTVKSFSAGWLTGQDEQHPELVAGLAQWRLQLVQLLAPQQRHRRRRQ
jgi:hypothetical protein